MRFRSAILAGASAMMLAIAPAQAPAQETNLPPDIYGALTELYQAATFQCQAGLQQGCNYAAVVQDYANQLGSALYWCQMNDPSACQFYQMGVQEVATTYQQYQANMAAQGYPRTPEEHQQIMMQKQQAFDAYQQNYQAQQQANDAAHQRFIQSIWD